MRKYNNWECWKCGHINNKEVKICVNCKVRRYAYASEGIINPVYFNIENEKEDEKSE